MQSNYVACFAIYRQREGGFVNDPRDPGGATNMGVTLGLLQRLGYDENHDGVINAYDVQSLTVAEVQAIVRTAIWNPIQGDALPLGLDLATFDPAAMSGPYTAAKWAQRAIAGATGKPLAIDGHIGPVTLAACRAMTRAQIHTAISLILSYRLAFYSSLSTFPIFGKGWTNRANAVTLTAQAMA